MKQGFLCLISFAILACFVSSEDTFNGNNIPCSPITVFPKDYDKWYTLKDGAVDSSSDMPGGEGGSDASSGGVTGEWKYNAIKEFTPSGRTINATYFFSGPHQDTLILEEYYRGHPMWNMSESIVEVHWEGVGTFLPPITNYYHFNRLYAKEKRCTTAVKLTSGAFTLNIRVAP